ncbi:MFS transporter [Promicromonospora sp. Populi]|uniref:MFS transporter n=1 Tax=Promicromonospora sp. Populi TaxID=3239420 RepID=UPI0034E2FC3B
MRDAFRSRTVRTFAATQFLMEVQFWFPVWLIYLLDLGFSLATALLADAVFRIVSVVCELPMGVLADRIGRKNAYLLTCGLSAGTFAAITFISNDAWLLGAWIAWGVLWALNSGATAPYLYELCAMEETPVDPAKAFGLVRAVGNSAVVCSLLAAGYLYDADPRLPFAITAGLSVVAMILAARLPSVPRSHDTRLRSILLSIRRELRGADVRRAVWIGALLLFFGWSARILFQPLALDLDLSPQVTGWMYAAFAAAGVLGSTISGSVTRRRRRVAVLAAFVCIVLALASTAAADHLGPFLFLPVMGFGYALGMTVVDVYTNEATSRAVRGAIFSVAAALAGLGIAVARPALGLLSDDRSPAFAAGIWAVVGVGVVLIALPAIRRIPAALGPDRQSTFPWHTGDSMRDGSGH